MRGPVNVLKAKHRKEMRARVALAKVKGSPPSAVRKIVALRKAQEKAENELNERLDYNTLARADVEYLNPSKGGVSSKKGIVKVNWIPRSRRTRTAQRMHGTLRYSGEVLDEVARLRVKDAEKLYRKRGAVSIFRRIRDYFKGFY